MPVIELKCICAWSSTFVFVPVDGGGGGGDIKAYEDWIQQVHDQNPQVTIEE